MRHRQHQLVLNYRSAHDRVALAITRTCKRKLESDCFYQEVAVLRTYNYLPSHQTNLIKQTESSVC